MEEAIAVRAKANKEQSGKEHGIGKVPQISAKPITPIETREEIAKLAGVSRDTVDKVKMMVNFSRNVSCNRMGKNLHYGAFSE